MGFIFEKVESREGTTGAENPDRVLRYGVGDEFDDTVVDSMVAALAPPYYAGLPRQNWHKNHEGGGVWEIEVKYGRKTPRTLGSVKFSFDTTGEKEKIKEAIESTYYKPTAKPEIDFQHAINVQRSGGKIKVEGVDIIIPRMSFQLDYILNYPPSGDFIDNLFLKTGSINSDEIETLIDGAWTLHAMPGELLFMGATGEEDSIDPITQLPTFHLTLKFEFSPNQVGLVFGDEIGMDNVDKRGHDYLWVSYEEEADAVANVMVPRPVQVCVEQVYPETTMTELFL